MRSLKVLVLLVVMFLIPAAIAALPPHYQRLAEINAILNNTGVAEIFGIEKPIESIEYLAVDVYRVTGGGCHMFVRLFGKAMPEGFVGARQFDIVLNDLHCG